MALTIGEERNIHRVFMEIERLTQAVEKLTAVLERFAAIAESDGKDIGGVE